MGGQYFLIKTRHRQARNCSLLEVIAVLWSLFVVLLLIEAYIIVPIENQSLAEWVPTFLIANALLAAIIVCVSWMYTHRLKSQGFDHKDIEPYKFKLDFSDKDELLQQVSGFIELHQVSEDTLYGFQAGKRNIRLFVFQMDEYDKNTYKRNKTKAQHRAIQKGYMNSSLKGSEVYKATRINLLLTKKSTDAMSSFLQRNAMYGMRYAESVLEVIVDVNTMIMWVPTYCGIMYGESAKYLYSIKKLLTWMCLL